MQIFVDLDTRRLRRSVSNSSPVTQLDFKRGDTELMEIFFVRSNAQVQIAAGAVISFGAKIKDEYDGEALVFEDVFTLSGSGATAKYSANPSFNTVPLDAALMVDADEANDIQLLDLMGEITWNEDGVITSSVTFAVRVNNDVLRGDEATPAALPDPADWMPAALTFAGADPNIPETLTITGITSPVASDPLTFTRGADSGGFAAWSTGDGWTVYNTAGGWNIADPTSLDYVAGVASASLTPVSLTGWTLSFGEGQPIITGNTPTASHVGQLCKASTAWWIWNGSAWIPFATLNGSPVAYNATLLTYRKLTVSGADGSEIITISAL